MSQSLEPISNLTLGKIIFNAKEMNELLEISEAENLKTEPRPKSSTVCFFKIRTFSFLLIVS